MIPIEPENNQVFDVCPHCGHKLSPWQQVLLGVDRALTCRNCWYRILLDVYDKNKPNKIDSDKGKVNDGII